MKTRTMWGIVIAIAALTFIAGGAGAMSPQVAPGDAVPSKINYQGRLTSSNGAPLNGAFDMRFQIYDDPDSGTVLWDSGVTSVSVDQGLFNVELAVNSSDFNGQGLWLRIYVDGEWLAPRQELTPTPYALSLRPGAEIHRNDSGNALEVVNNATGSAVWSNSVDGYGVFGYSENGYGVYGVDLGATQGKGYGGYFTSNTGVGVYGYSSASSVTANAYTPGVYGRSSHGVGVYGLSDDDEAGVFGQSDGYGVEGISRNSHGVRGSSEAPRADEGYGGYFTSDNYRGLYAQSATIGSFYAGYFKGQNSSSAGIWIDGTLTATGSKSGYVVDISLYDGSDFLEVGDVVAVVGAAEPIVGDIPVMRVRKATDKMASAVVGVVDQRFLPESGTGDSLPHPDTDVPRLAAGTAIARGEYVTIVTLGAFKAIKVDASYGAIQPGDLLVSSPNPGHAMRADDPRAGTVIGKALGELSAGAGVIPVLVTLH